MSSLVAHRLCADEILKKMNNDLKQIILKYPEAYSIGSSGPDLFYFYNFLPFNKKDNKQNIYNIGTIMHYGKVNQAFRMGFDNIKHAVSDKALCEEMLSYYAGWLTHYALDRNTHPYICYNSGFNSIKADDMHRRFEADIDCCLLKERYHTDIKHYKPYHIADYKKDTYKAISMVYHNICKEIGNYEMQDGDFKAAVHDFRQLYFIMHDPHGWRFKLLSKIEPRPYAFTGTMIKNQYNEAHDVLNLKHSKWKHPCIENLESNDDYLRLFDNGIEDGLKMLNILNDIILNKDSFESLLKIIENRDYVRGISEPLALIYHNCIYK